MAEHDLPTAGHVDLDDGFVLHVSNFPGTVRATKASPGSRDLSAAPLDILLQDNGLRLEKVIELPPAPATVRDLPDPTSTPSPSAALDVDVPADESYLLLVQDNATHALTWLIPTSPPDQAGVAGTRGLSRTLRFNIPLRHLAHTQGARDFAGLVDLGKTIKAFAFKVTDALLGPIIHGFARKWETTHRPTLVRLFGPDNFRNDDPDFPAVDETGWRQLSQGRALLFVHGTFSTCGAFSQLDPATMAELSQRYGGRLFAFNHPTMATDPRENALAFLSAIPPSTKLEIDIVCHSRGGLVAREIAALGLAQQTLTVRRVVFVGATNAGTILADADHMIDMIDRFTTIAHFIPTGPAQRIVDALILVVKVVGHGFLDDLEGLKAMDPRGPFMQALNVPGPAGPDLYAIASDFQPKPGTPFLSLTRVENFAIDRVFENSANDLVVPRDGVFSKNGAMGFPITDARCLLYGPADGVIHTEFFSQPQTAAKLIEWLQPVSATQGRSITSAPSFDEISRAFDTFRDRTLAMLTGPRGLGPAQPSTSLTPAELEALRPHVISLREGKFDQSALFSTTATDVDAIIGEHLPKWAQAQPENQPLRVVIWAHGGLVGELKGLQIAQKHVGWWKQNGVYPLYFVWQTGLFDALRSILESVARKLSGLGTRGFLDYTTDPLVQEGARALGGVSFWGAMKDFAQKSSDPQGGAHYTATQLASLAKDTSPLGKRPLELHAVGHSAGAIFHSWFLPTAIAAGIPKFTTLQLLAPAITVDDFLARLAPTLNSSVAQTTMYTMKRTFEEADNCIEVYRKSLLYLIYHALEPQRRTPILGLEISARANTAVSTLFGLNGRPNSPGHVVWSISDTGDARSSSRAVHHGDFDDDPLTMNSVAANVLAQPNARVPYTETVTREIGTWPQSDDWLTGVDLSAIAPPGLPSAPLPGGPPALSPAAPPSPYNATPPPPPPIPKPSQPIFGSIGARRALCVGIDAYPSPNTLTGCVNDTKIWNAALTALGFQVKPLTNTAATHAAIVSELRDLVTDSKRGDILVFHYSGHGVEVPDLDGDEDDMKDQAMVPIDFTDGAFLIDDDIRAIFNLLPDGVNLTAFVDCCHSGTITRLLGRTADIDEKSKARFLKPTPDWNNWMNAHERFRGHVSATQSTPLGARSLKVDRNAIRWVNFSACRSDESALESDGNGDFSRYTTRLLGGDISKYTHRSFQDAVLKAFGEQRKQTPYLDCPDASLHASLLQPQN